MIDVLQNDFCQNIILLVNNFYFVTPSTYLGWILAEICQIFFSKLFSSRLISSAGEENWLSKCYLFKTALTLIFTLCDAPKIRKRITS